MKLNKRFNILYNEFFLSCLSPWGKKTTRLFKDIVIKNNIFFFKQEFCLKSFSRFISQFLKDIFGGWYIRLKFVGFGYKYKIFYKKIRIYLGHSHNIDVPLQNGVICLKDKLKYHILLYALDVSLIKQVILKLKELRPLNNYKFLGILYTKQPERLKLKKGKQQQYR